MRKIFFFNADRTGNFKNKTIIKDLIESLFKEEKVSLDRINYIFCSDEYLFAINRTYLKHNTLTDIITFPLSDQNNPVFAEIYISVERIKENAKAYNVSYQNEFLRVMIHGALHLCGYKDKSQSDRQKMRAKEHYYLNQTNVSREANF